MALFISYSARDADLAKKLRAKLTIEGIDVIDPEGSLKAGENWPLALGRALERADMMVVLVSPDALRSEFLGSELEYALGNARFKGRLVPVLVRPTPKMPWILGRLSVIDVTKDDPGHAVNKIVNAVNERYLRRRRRDRTAPRATSIDHEGAVGAVSQPQPPVLVTTT
jgi:hypothetical protein